MSVSASSPRKKRLTRKQWRMVLVGSGFLAVTMAVTLVLVALNDTIVLFYSPSEIQAGEIEIEKDRPFRLGGLVAAGTVVRSQGEQVSFEITDLEQTVPVVYTGLLPDLFREGQGVVAQGKLDEDGVFVASQVLAKHDENYMPPEAHEALKRAGKTLEDAEAFEASVNQGKTTTGAGY